MNIKDVVGVDNYGKDLITGEEISFEEQYDKLIEYLGGIEKVMEYVNLTKEQIRDAYKKDKNLNNINIHSWDRWAGFESYGNTVEWKLTGLRNLFRAKGITFYSPSQLVCTLKRAAIKYSECE